ncbi:hypothetical protein [Jeotgalibacillus campisalis]|uniref:Holin n=1 Tax=Jeotgalibacillus campisalis TaxID=220754 RepID=A0A0C2WA66_9BACL|nr:hypothetical protein [Jeotgalibacillus campisalis]KIL52943.1 hypothetical protein KR50_02720 [Jeotgalibacillus campisalis]
MSGFPVIHTTFWDAVIAVPAIVVIIQLLKLKFSIPKFIIPTLANALGLLLSIFISHSGHLAAGIFMGFFYGNAAVGVYASIKTSIVSYLNKVQRKKST